MMHSAYAAIRRATPLALCAASLAVSLSASDGPIAVESLARLKAGNARFVANPADPLPIDAAQRTATAQAHQPIAAILSCTDPRVPPEVVFHAGLGELVVVRAEGQVTDKAVLASLERAATVKHVPLVVVMGHESCDLVRSAQDGDHGGGESGGHAHEPGGNVEYLTKQVRPAVSRAATLPADVRLRGAILANVEEQINELLSSSEVVRRRVDSGQLAIVGAYYELASGLVHFSEFVKVAPALAEATGKH